MTLDSLQASAMAVSKAYVDAQEKVVLAMGARPETHAWVSERSLPPNVMCRDYLVELPRIEVTERTPYVEMRQGDGLPQVIVVSAFVPKAES